jgi:alpha-glucosidase (family GH31 glycosyl hydrolase)|nr:TIM-barrel domain-containing protein [Kofleriaceae bacterium]
MTRALVVCALAACGGGNDLAAAPPTISAGPVTIDTATLGLTIGSAAIAQFLSIGEVAGGPIATTYYDPAQPIAAGATLTPIAGSRGVDGDALVLTDGTRLHLRACPIASCAELDIDASAHAGAVFVQLALPHVAGDPLYGTGDAPAGANVAGTVREMQLRVSTTVESGTNETHVPVPLVLDPRSGIGALLADDRPAALDLGATDPTRVTATTTLPARGPYRVFLFTATTPADLVRAYIALTAKPAVPPRWAFSPMLWRNEWDSDAELGSDAAEQRALGIPGSTIWIDNPWQTGYNTFDVDTTRFADLAGTLAALSAQGYNVIFWSSPYLVQTGITAADFTAAQQAKALVTDDSGHAMIFPFSDGPAGMIDFTNPSAAAAWQARVAKATSIGGVGFKLDFGEDLVPDLGGTILPMELEGGDNLDLHARFAQFYHATYQGSVGVRFLITRAGAWGEQSSNTAIWPGDLDSDLGAFGSDNGAGKTTVGGLPSAISRGLALSVSGYPFYGSDIGGFRSGPNNGAPTTETLLRWAEYAAYGTIMQLGGGGPSHDPWDTTLFDGSAAAVYAKYATVHAELVPLIASLAAQAGSDGTPVTTPAGFAYDCACDDAMFLLGSDVLVAPVIAAGATTRDVVLPPGDWVDTATGARVAGDGATTTTVPAPIDVVPVWYRAGSLVPMYARYADTELPVTQGSATSYADAAIGGELRLVYSPADGATAVAALDDGAAASATAGALTFTAGSRYTAATFDVDARALTGALAAPASVTVGGTALPIVADVTTCAAPGCYSFDATAKHLQVRIFSGTATVQ